MNYREISISKDEGSAEGYAVGAGSVNLQNYLTGETEFAEIILAVIREKVETIAVFKSLRVDEDSRGAGIGRKLVSEFMAEAEADAEAVILLADAHESQVEGFVLERFYEGFKFERVADTSAGPLMVFPADLATHIRARLAAVQAPGTLEQYLQGSCHHLAVALHRAYGFGFMLLVDTAEDASYGGVPAVHHVLATDGAGFAVDALGRRLCAEVQAQWEFSEEALVQNCESTQQVLCLESEEELQEYVGAGWDRPLSDYQDADIETALVFANQDLRDSTGAWRVATPVECA